MKFKFYSAEYIGQDGIRRCNTLECEFKDLDEATEFMRRGSITQDDLGMAFIPLVCEAIEEEDK